MPLLKTRDAFFEVDLVDGKCTGASGENSGSRGLGVVSPDKKVTADCENRMITIRDRKGNIKDEFFVPVFWPEAELTWLDSKTLRLRSANHLLHFVDLQNRVALLEVIEMGASSAEDRGWNVIKTPQGGDWFFTISPVLATADGASGLPSLDECRARILGKGDDLLLLKKGDRVSLIVDLQADPSVADEARKIVEDLLAERGVIIDESADDELRLESSVSEESIDYRSFGSPPWDKDGIETVKVQLRSSSMKLIREGKVVWSVGSNSGHPGFILFLKEGETAQQAVDRQNVAPEDFWKKLKLPRHIAMHPNGNSWVRYQKTVDGYQPLN
jgi:hypothetical protein